MYRRFNVAAASSSLALARVARSVGVLAFVSTPAFAFADVCPDPKTPVTTTPYAEETKCPVVTILVKGESNPPRYASCLGDVPSSKESVSFHGLDGVERSLPTVLMMLPKPMLHPDRSPPSKQRLAEYGDFRRRTWIASDVRCRGSDGVSIYYWGGGNCVGCERFAEYRFSKHGTLLRSYLRPFQESDRQALTAPR
jgi:hypothetical protein